jgi:nucleoid DNA-binding protein
MAKTSAGGTKTKSSSKTVIHQKLADATKLTKKQVAEFFVELTKLIKNELGKKGPGVFTLPGLVKFQRKEKKATKARPGRNPQTGEAITIPAKPKRTVVRASPLKDIRDLVK